ncbi:MAG: hypothetical protein ABIH86_05160 [Planctomycetota bacterium]
MIGYFIFIGVGLVFLFCLIFGFRILIPALKPAFSKKIELEGIADEDGWGDGERGVNVKRAGIGLGIILFPFVLYGIFWIHIVLTTHSTSSSQTARQACTTILSETQTFETSKDRLPKTLNDYKGRLDDGIYSASHEIGLRPSRSYRNSYFCVYFKPDSETGKTAYVGVYAYPAKYSKTNNRIFYRTNESGTTYQAYIWELYPNVRYGSPVPLFNAFIHENDLTSAFTE